MTRVLIADDLASVRHLLKQIIGSAGDMTVVGEAVNGMDAIQKAEALQPDVIVMDVNMPILTGIDATGIIMAELPTPIVIVSATTEEDVNLSMRALSACALTVLKTPAGPAAATHSEEALQLIETVRAMAVVKVVRRRAASPVGRPIGNDLPKLGKRNNEPPEIIGIAASTGGPPVLERILSNLPELFPVPILITQHIASGFTAGLVDWLSNNSYLEITIPEDGEPMLPGSVYVAPDDLHLAVDDCGAIRLVDAPPVGRFRPSANYLFDSLAENYGSAAMGIVLTGMGSDGVEGLRRINEAGGIVIAQDEPSCAVYGMPAVAREAGVVDQELPPDGIVSELRKRFAVEASLVP